MIENPPGNVLNQQDDNQNDLVNITNINGDNLNNQNEEIEDTGAPRDIFNPVPTQARNNNNRRTRTKWTREMNENVVRSYFKALHSVPDQQYRKEMYNQWKLIYPETTFSEQRICDQKREIFKKAESNENIRGNWVSMAEINQMRYDIIQPTINEDHQQQQPLEINNLHEQHQHPNGERIANYVQEIEQNGDLEADQDEKTIVVNNVLNTYAEIVVTPFSERYTIRNPGKKDEKKLLKSLGKINEAIEDNAVLTNLICDVKNLNDFTYACALTAIRLADLEKKCIYKKKDKNAEKKKDWQKNMLNKIDTIRGDISKIDQIILPNQSSKIKRNTANIKAKYNIKTEQERIVTLETLKQRLKALNNRHQRFVKRQKQFNQNLEFENNPSKFYDEVRGNKIEITDPPAKDDVVNFWKPMFTKEKHFNKNATWLNDYKNSINEIQQAEYNPITNAEIDQATKKFQNWKSPGIDKLQNFWWSKLTNLHTCFASILDHVMQNPNESPLWFTTGRTTLIPKKKETRNPSNYRPITCLPVMYKILTSILTSRMKHHIEANNIIPEEQKGCASNSYGTIDQLAINKMIMLDAINNQRNLSTAWIDYKKAYDSIPHEWLIETLTMHKFDQITVTFFKETIQHWRTSINLNIKDSICTEPFKISTGMFQGDSPSGLNFILCLLPLSWLLKSSNLGYKPTFIDEKKCHLLFMDDLKLYAANDQQLTSLIKVVKIFSDDIGMEFGIDKCNKMTIIRGKVKPSNGIKVNDEEIKALNNEQYYKYLGFNERQSIDKTTKEKLQQEYFTRIKKILKTELNSKNTINAINAYTVPSLSYGFQIIDWSITDLTNIDRLTRKLLQKHYMQHKQGDVTRLYIPRSHGGRGLINITNLYKSTIIKFGRYLQITESSHLRNVSDWQHTRGDKSIHHKASVYCRELNIDYQQLQQMSKTTVKSTIKKNQITSLVNELHQKPTHGQFLRNMDQPYVDKTSSLLWLKSSTLKRSTEATICAIQEQAITTRYIQHHIHHTSDSDICRVCREKKETIHHIIGGCSVLAPTKYLKRHDDLGKYIHALLLFKHEVINEIPPWYHYNPPDVIESESVKVLWNFTIQTDHEIAHNRPDITLVDKRSMTAYLIDIAVPNDIYIAERRLDKIRNYTNLANEIKTLWQLRKVDIIPIVIGATGMFYHGLDDDLKKLDIEKEFNKSWAQKIVLLGTAHIVRAFLQIA